MKVALVTGGTDGIGKEIARGLARAGNEVIIVGRNPEKGNRATQELRRTTGNERVTFLSTDLSFMRETDALAAQIRGAWASLDYLVLCAGIVRGRRTLTSEGIESNFAVSYLSRFALTSRLLPLLEAAGQPNASARVVIIGGAARNGTIFFDDVNLARNFSTLRAVGQFCQANDVFTLELARRLKARNLRPLVTVTSLKIGVVKTNIRKEFPAWMKLLVPLVLDPLLGQTPQEAAEPALRLLLSPEFEGVNGGLFLKVRKFKGIAVGPRELDLEHGQRLWKLSERMINQSVNMNLSLF